MAKIFITGRNPIEITKDEAIRINEMWVASRPKGKEYLIPEVLEAGGQTFLSKDIKGFEFGDGLIQQEQSEYNVAVDGPEKDKVRAFESVFETWKSQHPEITAWHEAEYLQAQGVIKMGKHRPDDTIIDIGDHNKKYFELKKLFASLQTLKYYREKAQANNDPDFEAKRIAMFNELKSKLPKRYSEPIKIKKDEQENLRALEIVETNRIREQIKDNPALAKLKADARAFDEAHGLNQEIDPALIPF